MCDYKLSKYDRPLKKTEKILLVSREIFNKIFDEKYFRVLISQDRDGLSKSYYYYILDFYKNVGLIEDNALISATIIPFVIENDKIVLDKALLSVTKNGLVLIDLNSNKYKCDSCPLKAECKYGLKNVASQLKIKPKGRSLNEIWDNLISQLTKKVINKVVMLPIP
ncbi:hypothetical protein EWF20_12240 [Sulfolobus sp. S-194]|uniref:hypothetical protein n=1 Tax=Sulfolobus sp. S-194 TaxID=2512240 RepID=UPI001436D1CB|nr:hypothetical protein [Sulfolobus sp. S-194]QIW24817.1 hypothetical protein EWF20_12240 [Sulfolobus sp. S-194]